MRSRTPSGPKKKARCKTNADNSVPLSLISNVLEIERTKIYMQGKPVSESLDYLKKIYPLTHSWVCFHQNYKKVTKISSVVRAGVTLVAAS